MLSSITRLFPQPARICNRPPIRPSARLPVLSLAVWVLACSTGDVTTQRSGTIIDSAGVTIVSNPADGAWREADGWSVVQDIVIGESEGDPDYVFGHITGMCLGSDGRIFVLDQGASRISVYSAEGLFLDAFGQSGSGPGEMGTVVGPCLMGPEDTLNIPDLQNFRLNRYASDGSSVGSNRFDLRDGFPTTWNISEEGRIVVQLRSLPIPGQTADSMDALVVRDRDGSVIDTVLRVPAGGTVAMRRDGPRLRFFAPEPAWALTPDGEILYGRNDDYRITVYDDGGEPRRIVKKIVEPRPVSDADRRIWSGAIARGLRDSGMPQALISQILETVTFADFYPAFTRLQSGPLGSIWVRRMLDPTTLSEEERENLQLPLQNPEVLFSNPTFGLGTTGWDVFDADGRLLGVVTMPPRFEPVRFVEDKIYGIWRDEFDVEYVMRLRVVMP